MKEKLNPLELRLLQLQINNLKYIRNTLNIVLNDLIPPPPDIVNSIEQNANSNYKKIVTEAILKTTIQLEILNDVYNEQ